MTTVSAIEFSDCAPKSGRHTAYDEIRGISIVLPHQPLIHLDPLSVPVVSVSDTGEFAVLSPPSPLLLRLDNPPVSR